MHRVGNAFKGSCWIRNWPFRLPLPARMGFEYCVLAWMDSRPHEMRCTLRAVWGDLGVSCTVPL